MAGSQRVSYAEGQRISAADLESEQIYLLGLDARHNQGEHGPGVATGLIPATDASGDAILTAGVAIDAQGRELLSSAAVANPGAGGACVDLWIVYCLVPQQSRRPGTYDCGATAFPRWNEFGKIVTSAGVAGSAPVSPYDGAVYLGRLACKDTPDEAYTALVGQSVADPGARTWLQVGPANGRDRYGFLLSSQGTAGAVQPRIGIDRLGRNTLWGDLSLLGYNADALLPSPVAGFSIRVVSKIPGDAGEQIRARVTPFAGGGVRSLALSFLSGCKPFGKPLNLVTDSKSLEKQLADFNQKSTQITLSLVPQPEKPPETSERKPAPALVASLITAQDTPLTATGGNLELQGWPDPPAPVQAVMRGCQPQTTPDTPEQLPNGISFTPPAEAAKRKPLPGVSAAAITEKTSPVVQLRLDLGIKKDNDPFERLAIGGPDQNGVFNPWLTGDGTGNLWIHGAGAAAVPSINLNVTGRIEQGPIEADPTDPRFTTMVVLAWLHGLQSSVEASTVVTLAMSGLPALIETGKAWQYQVTASNSGTAVVLADKTFETRLIAGQTLLTNIANQTSIDPGGSQAFTIQHRAGDMGTVGSLSIEVRMSGKMGNFPWWKAVTGGPIPVVASPSIDMSGLPASAPPGAAFDYSFTITNTANVSIHLDSVTVTQGAAAPLQLPIGAPEIAQNGQQLFGPVNQAAGINADLPVQIDIAFTWANGVASSVTANKTIASHADLRVQFQNVTHPVPVGAAWSYDLVLTNTGSQALSIPAAHGLQQRLSSADFATTAWVDIPVAAEIDLNPGESHTEANVAATLVPAATHDFTLEIQPVYQRENRTWSPEPTTKDIHIP